MDESNGRLVLHTDITDWGWEAQRAEIPLRNKVDLVTALGHGMTTAQLARIAIAMRERGDSPSDLIRPNKLLLQVGAQYHIAKEARNARHEVKIANGATANAHDLIGLGHQETPAEDGERTFQTTIPGTDGEDIEPPRSYVAYNSPQASELARNYLLKVVPGHIETRLLTIHENGGDVRKAADELRAEINRIVRKIVGNAKA